VIVYYVEGRNIDVLEFQRRFLLVIHYQYYAMRVERLEMKKKLERQQNHLITGVVDQLLLIVKPPCISNAIGLNK